MTVLVVDDERDVELLFRQRFRKELRAGIIDLAFAFSGEEAIEYLERTSADIVLVLSDINMPGMNGLELLRKLKERLPQLPVYMVTAYEGDFHSRAIELGADGYFNKPIDFDDLKRRILLLARVE
ncbi:MAG: response regulator [Ignavibacteria bacterium]|nr:response regulator [Ignavibacteria bacterium]